MSVLKTETLPKALTSYDLLKTLAILLMVIDHVGYFFFPEEAWFRVVGRLCVPIWFFLIGYANTREIPRLWWSAAIAVFLSAIITGGYIFPVNILFTLIFARFAIDWVMMRGLRNHEAFAGMFFLCVLLSLPSMIFVEYGFIGILFAMMGYMRRHKSALEMKPRPYWMFVAGSAGAYILMQAMLMESLSAVQLGALITGMGAVVFLLHGFKGQTYPHLKGAAFWAFQFCGRRTLEIYAFHLLAFRAASMILNPDRFSAFDFTLFANENLTRLFL